MPDQPPATLPDDYTLSRRGAAKAIAAGYSILATAADADPIITSTSGLIIEDVTMAGGLPGHVARPAKPGTYPAVIVVCEIFGVHQWIKDICRRLAKAGYVAVAPGFFYRADSQNKIVALTDMAAVRAIVNTAGLDQQMADVKTTVAWLAKQKYAATGRAAITGFCWGGAVTWMAAAKVPGIKAGAAWYGRLSGGADTSRPYPLTSIEALRVPVLGLYGGKDRGIPLNDVKAMSAALEASTNPSAKASRLLVYANADHGFLADYRPSYSEADSKDAWDMMMSFFKQHV